MFVGTKLNNVIVIGSVFFSRISNFSSKTLRLKFTLICKTFHSCLIVNVLYNLEIED